MLFYNASMTSVEKDYRILSVQTPMMLQHSCRSSVVPTFKFVTSFATDIISQKTAATASIDPEAFSAVKSNCVLRISNTNSIRPGRIPRYRNHPPSLTVPALGNINHDSTYIFSCRPLQRRLRPRPVPALRRPSEHQSRLRSRRFICRACFDNVPCLCDFDYLRYVQIDILLLGI